MSLNSNNSKLVIVSNRLPFVIEQKEDKFSVHPGSGGLVTALAPVLRDRGGLWIGWPGDLQCNEEECSRLMREAEKTAGFLFSPVFLTKEEVGLYYEGFSNAIIWPLFHDLQTNCHFLPEYWTEYQKVNEKFSGVVLEKTNPDDFIWVHDYHLMLLGQELRNKGSSSKLAFFLHIPFPPLDIFINLPWRFQIVHALLQYDLIGFQTMRDRRNFTQCIRRLIPEARISGKRNLNICAINQREVRFGAFPISIDYHAFSRAAESKKTEELVTQLRKAHSDQRLVFSLDRLDYTKGIPYRLEGIRSFLKLYPEFHRNVTFIQVVIPSRAETHKYQELKEEINRTVGEINSQFTLEGWVPIHYLFRPLTHFELLAYYRVSSIALITPVKDGMNLVAKEFVACKGDNEGVLVLSEFAGVASQFYEDAIVINPYDILGIAESLNKALILPVNEQIQRMHHMQRNVRRYDLFWWVETYLNAAIGKDLLDFPVIQEYIPASN